MTSPDYSIWLTKQKAAAVLGVSTKTVEKLAHDKVIQQAVWKRPTGGPALAVYHPDDVARMARERHVDPPPFVLPADPAMNGHGRGVLAMAAPMAAPDDGRRALAVSLSEFAAALRELGATSSEASEKSQSLFVTLAEASAVTGLPQADLQRAIEAGELPCRKTGRGGIRIRRKDLEAL